METAIWYIPIILATIAILSVIPGISIATEKSNIRCGRKDFAIASLLFFVIYPIPNRIFSRFFETMGNVGLAFSGILLLIFCFIWYKYTKLVVRRARDAGLRKKYCYIFVIPIVNLLFVVFLMIKKSAPVEATSHLEPAA